MINPGKHKLIEAIEGQTPADPVPDETQHGPGRGPNPREVAESTRREQESQHNGKNDLDRDRHLVQVGRGQQTHG